MMLWLLTLLFWLAPAAWAQSPKDSAALEVTYLSSIRRELACYCGCGMTVQDCLGGMVCSESRALSQEVIQFLEQGKSREQVLQAMAVKYGERILSAPTKKGFNLAAWVLPFVALLVGAVIAGRLVSRWRRQTATSIGGPAAAPESAPDGSPYQARLEEELREFDR